MPRPDRRARLRDARLYLCTGARQREADLPEFLDAVLAGGVDIVQLREKGLEAREEMALAEVFSDAAQRHGALFSVNDRADVAHAVRADILHLGQGDLPVDIAREIVDDDTVIGLSTHAPAEAEAAAMAAGVDYFCVGPAWTTPTKPGRPAAGIDLVTYAATVADPTSPAARPWFAIGGIDHERLPQVLAAGARRIVVVRAITDAEDPGAAAAEFAARLRE